MPRLLIPRRCPKRFSIPSLYHYSSSSSSSTSSASSAPPPPPAPPPLLLRLRSDLKAAIKARDQDRLSVLRGVLTDISNSAKSSSSPSGGVTSDLHILPLLRKRANAARHAARQFAAANRPDLQRQEEDQLAVIDEYAGLVEDTLMGRDEVDRIVRALVAEMRAAGDNVDAGVVMKRSLGKNGVFGGKSVDGDVVKQVVREVLGSGAKS